MLDNIVEVKNISKKYDISAPLLNRLIERKDKVFLPAVNDVSFQIKRGETFSIVGESGCGKSTLAKMVVNLVEPTSGEILINNKSWSQSSNEDKKNLRRKIQMIFQDPYASMNPKWKVLDIIAEPMVVLGLVSNKKEIVQKVQHLLTLVKLSPNDINKYPHEFSGGQRQRLCIARALASNAEFIVCDEPTSALDVSVQAQILNLMKELQNKFNLTYLFISHDLSVVRHMSDRIAVMYLGKICEIANKKEMFANPKHPYSMMLLDSVPSISSARTKKTNVIGEIPDPTNQPLGCTFNPRCKFAINICKQKTPELETIGNSLVSCFVAN